MAINKDEIDKYIFDPENPKQCKSYNLLLKIAKKKNCVHVSSEFIDEEYKDLIFNKDFFDSLWDEPEDFKNFSTRKKIRYFINSLSHGEYHDHINTLQINDKNFKYNQLFNCFFDVKHDGKYLEPRKVTKMLQYEEKSLRSILQGYSYLYGDSQEDSTLWGHKILFTNEVDILEKHELYHVSSVLITTNKDLLLEATKNAGHLPIIPIYLKKIEDVHILLNVLDEDLKKENKKNIPQENISTLNEISVQNFFSIKDINLKNLKDKKEIYIVGENGDGKSLLLQSIAVGLKGTQEDGLKEFRIIEDKYTIEIENSEDCQNNFLSYGSSRNNSCQLKEDTTGYLTLFSGEYDLKSPTKWLQYLDYSEQKENNNVITVSEAKKLLQELLNSDIEIDISPNKVTFTEKGSEVSFEQLSAGYKGVITIICDMIARLSEKQQVEHIKDFQGVVLIDEVELHLHPKWQYSFMNKLREIFPLIQFIVTTHSPTVLLGAGMEAVYYEISKDKETGVVKISEQKEVKNDFLNDIQFDIFGFDVNEERINNPSNDDKKRQKRAKENLLNLIDTIEKGN